MKKNIICDFHIHSHYSIATSKNLIPEFLDYWARIKGISVVGTGDFTHPGWLNELKEKLEPAEQGLFRLKEEYKSEEIFLIPSLSESEIRFILTAEISNIYKKGDKVRKVHNVIFAPEFKIAEKIQDQLDNIGNITSDGRPILGLDSRNLLEIALNASENIFFVPAHIWTPWFSALGDKSGFETIQECYGDLDKHIFAVETGLSSDPPMNWMCSFLDKYTLISNSDAHSPEKLGREANLLNTDLTYDAIIGAIKSGEPEHFLGTIEFFPQEGKYHYDGHRKCGVCWDPVETLRNNSLCPICEKRVTVGVMNRVVQLSNREALSESENRPPFYSMIPLKEILSEITGVGPSSKKVGHMYHSLIQKMGSEFNILFHLPIDEIARKGNDLLGEAIRRMRDREVFIKEGFDGEFGQIRVFHENESKNFGGQDILFQDLVRERGSQYKARKLIEFDLEEFHRLRRARAQNQEEYESSQRVDLNQASPQGLNVYQHQAVEHGKGPALVIAGPGTGKTRVLTHRIAHLIQVKNILPENILAVTFTNKAANEMKDRLLHLLNDEKLGARIYVSTFHAFGYSILRTVHPETGRDKHFLIIDGDEKEKILHQELGCEQKSFK